MNTNQKKTASPRSSRHTVCQLSIGSFNARDALKLLLAFSSHLEKTNNHYSSRVGIGHIKEGMVINDPWGRTLMYVDTKGFLWDIYFAHPVDKDVIEARLESILVEDKV